MLLLVILVVFPKGLLVAERRVMTWRPPAAHVVMAGVPRHRSTRSCVWEPHLTTFLFTLLYAYIVAQSWDWLHGEAGYVNLGHYIYFGVGATRSLLRT